MKIFNCIAKQLRSNDGKLHWFAVTPLVAKRIDLYCKDLNERLTTSIVFDIVAEITTNTKDLKDGEEIILEN